MRILRASPTAAALVALTGGCSLALGLDTYVEEQSSSAGGGGGAGAVGGEGGTGAGGTGGEGGADPSDCWGKGLQEWTTTAADTTSLQATDPTDFALSPDRLTLHYLAGASDDRQLYRATRPTIDDPFSSGETLTAWSQTDLYSSIAVVEDEEVLVTVNAGAMGDVFSSLFTESWSQPASVPDVSTLESETVGAITQDRLNLLIARGSGDPSGYYGVNAAQLHEYARASVTSAWQSVPFDMPDVGTTDWILCPAWTSDGLRMFFSSSHEAVLMDDLPDNAIVVYFSERPTLTAPWRSPERVAVLDGGSFQVCVDAISDDGCELWTTSFMLDQPGGVYRVSRRDAL